MADILSLEEERKRRRQIKRYLLWLVLFLIGLVLLLIYVNRDELRTFDAGDLLGKTTDSTRFPVTLPLSNEYELFSTDTKLLLLTDTHLYVYNTAGKQLVCYQHGLNDPCIAYSESRCALYVRGSEDYSLITLNTLNTETVSTVYPISTIACADNGQICVVESGTRYLSELSVYDADLHETYRWQTQELITSAAFDTRNLIAAISLDAKGGALVSKVSLISVRQEEFVAELSFEENMLLSLDCKDNGSIIAIGDQAAVCINQKGELVSTYDYSSEGISYCENSDEVILMVLGNYVANKTNEVVVLDAQLNELGRRTVDEQIVSRAVCDSKAAVLLDSSLIIWEGNGFTRTEMEYGSMEVELLNGALIIRTASQLNKAQ